MKWFDVSLIINGYDIRSADKWLAHLRSMSCEERSKIQERLRMDIYHYHLDNNPFYRQFVLANGAIDSTWSKIPVIRKSDFQRQLDQMVALPYRNKRVYRNNTSGSSGNPFSFVKNKQCHALAWSNNKYLFSLHGIDFNSSLQARFYGIPLQRNKFIREKLKDYLAHRVRFPIFNLNDETCAEYLLQFERQPFVYLNGYTSSMVLFARYLVARQVVLSEVCPTLKVCITTSEMCSEEDRKIMELGFGVAVVNEYGAAELETIAFEDSEGFWRLNEENLFVEVVDENGIPVEDGREGNIVITSLHNRAMPFIRYSLGDRGIIAKEKMQTCGRVLEQLTGRVNDVAYLPSGKVVPGLTFYYITKGLKDKDGLMKEVVVRQVAINHFKIEYIRDTALTDLEERSVRQLMDLYLEPGLEVSFQKVNSINRTRMGKLQQFRVDF